MTTVMELCSNAVRGVIIAPRGKKLVVADLAGIENRVLAWLAGESWKLDAFRAYDAGEGPDMYKLAYAKAFNIPPSEVNKDQRQIGKVKELMLGYQGGVGAYLTGAATYNIDLEAMAKGAWDSIPDQTKTEAREFLEWQLKQGRGQFGLSDEAFIVCDSFKRLWRESNPMIAGWWKELEGKCVIAICSPGRVYESRGLKIGRTGQWLRIRLPSGRYLCYPSPRVDDAGKISYMGVNQYSRKWCRLKTYGGKLAENCIAEGTEVLTEKWGWKPIESVTPDSRVWDGDEWVSFSHCHYSGKQTTITAFGVRMTPDHLVLTNEGWRNASSCERYNRAACRLPDGYSIPRVEWEEIYMGSGLRLWAQNTFRRIIAPKASQAGEHILLRMHAESHDREAQHNTRDESAPGVRGLEIDDRSVSSSYPSSVAKLWGQGHNSLRRMAGSLREFLGGHGPWIFPRVDARAAGQYGRVLQGELRLAQYEAPSEQQKKQCKDTNPKRRDDAKPSGEGVRDGTLNLGLPDRARMADRSGAANKARVFDLVNCGPRHRFVVRGPDGIPLIVHNCVQAVARDVLAYSMPRIEAAGYEIILTVHDEVIAEADDMPEKSHEELAALMSRGEEWTHGLPLAAEGFESYRYKKG